MYVFTAKSSTYSKNEHLSNIDEILPPFLGQCLKDTFNVRPSHGIKVPTVCGINTGTHSKSILSIFF